MIQAPVQPIQVDHVGEWLVIRRVYSDGDTQLWLLNLSTGMQREGTFRRRGAAWHLVGALRHKVTAGAIEAAVSCLLATG